MDELQSRINAIEEQLRTPSPSAARSLVEATADLKDSEERRDAVEAQWWTLDIDRRRLIVDEFATVTIDPIKPGHTRFTADLIRIERKQG